MPGTLLAEAYPSAEQWKQLVNVFSADAIAQRVLLAHTPFVFRNEPAKFAVFRRIIADAFGVHPTDVFIVGSAMAGRSLKGSDIGKEYSPESDIDTLIISEPLFTTLLMKSLDWVRDVTSSEKGGDGKWHPPEVTQEVLDSLHKLADNACRGIWRPDSLPKSAAREDFFSRFERVSLHTLGLQLSEDTVAKVNGRVARSFEDAVSNLAGSIYRLRMEFRALDKAAKGDEKGDADEEGPAADA